MRRVALLLLVLLVTPSLPAAPGVHAETSEDRLGLRVTDDHLEAGITIEPVREARHAVRGLMRALGAGPGAELVPLLTFTQPIVRGVDDHIAVVGIVATGGTWRGLHWVEADGASVTPTHTTIGPEGRIFMLHGGADLAGDSLDASYHFLGIDGSKLVIPLPKITIYDRMPMENRIAFGGAALGAAHPELPRLLVVSTWNLLGHEASMGFSLLDKSGRAVDEHASGGCTAETWNQTTSESGCRALFIVEATGRELIAWHEDANGRRIEGDRLALKGLARQAYVHG